MAEVPGGGLALAPQAPVLKERALDPAQKATPGLPAPTVVPAVIGPVEDTSIFDETWFKSPEKLPGFQSSHRTMKSVLAEHNRRLPKIRAMRSAILAYALSELQLAEVGQPASTNLLETMVKTHRDVLTTGIKPSGMVRPYSAAGTLQDMYDRISGEDAKGGPGAYDPWNGWWGGYFMSTYDVDETDQVTGKTRTVEKNDFFHELHIWEPEIDIQLGPYSQRVQAVTQVDYPATNTDPFFRANNNWFASAAELLQFPAKCAFPNYAVNVWSPNDHLTGYVVKDIETFQPKSMIHIAFLIEPDVLIWVAVAEDSPGDFKGQPFDFFVFAEAGFPMYDFSGTYDISGAFASGGAMWASDGSFKIRGRMQKIAKQKGNYRQVPQYRDRASLELAHATGLTLNTHPDAVRQVLEMTRPL